MPIETDRLLLSVVPRLFLFFHFLLALRSLCRLVRKAKKQQQRAERRRRQRETHKNKHSFKSLSEICCCLRRSVFSLTMEREREKIAIKISQADRYRCRVISLTVEAELALD
jgi:hypothetical protein